MKRLYFKLDEIPLGERNLCFFDVETTGISISAEILELGMILVDPIEYKVIKELGIKIKPTRIEEADPEALMVNGYNEEEWKDAVDLETGIKQFLEFANESVLVANNITQDWLWVQKAIEDLELQPTYYYKALDIFPMAWFILGTKAEHPRLSLGELAMHFGIDQGHAHRALDDTRTTYKVFLKLIGK